MLMMKEFEAFVMRGNVVDTVVGIIILSSMNYTLEILSLYY